VQVELEAEMQTIGEIGIEKKTLEAFKEYKEANDVVNSQAIVTKFDEEELEDKKNAYLALKKGKKNI
jgi:hypothetical protein